MSHVWVQEIWEDFIYDITGWPEFEIELDEDREDRRKKEPLDEVEVKQRRAKKFLKKRK